MGTFVSEIYEPGVRELTISKPKRLRQLGSPIGSTLVSARIEYISVFWGMKYKSLSNTLHGEHDTQSLQTHMVGQDFCSVRDYRKILESFLVIPIVVLTGQRSPANIVESIIYVEHRNDGNPGWTTMG